MATYRVDVTNGDDTVAKASNDVDNQWKLFSRAYEDAADGDTIIVDAPDADNAVREMMVIEKDITVQATDGQEMFISPSFPCADGDVYTILGAEDYMDVFTGSPLTTAGGWADYAGAPALDEVGQSIGSGCILNPTLRKAFTHTNGKPYRLRVLFTAEAGAEIQFQVRGTEGTEYNFDFADETWKTAPTFNKPTIVTDETLQEYITPWIDGRDDSGFIQIHTPTTNLRLERVIQEYKANWILGTTGNEEGKYYLYWVTSAGDWALSTNEIGLHPQTPRAYKCTNAEWTASGEAALEVVSGATSLAAMTKGQSYYDGTPNFKFYYYPLDTETFSDLHIEPMRGPGGVLIQTASVDATLINPRVFAAQQGLILNTTGTVNVYNLRETATVISGVVQTGVGTANLYSPISAQKSASPSSKWQGGGYVSGADGAANASILNIYGGQCKFCGDDSYQPIGTGTLNLYGCTSDRPFSTDIEVNVDDTAVGGGMTINGFSGVGGETNSFREQSTAGAATVVMENCAFSDIHIQTAGHTYTVNSGVYCSASGASGGAAIPANVTNNVNYSATLTYADETNGDYTPVAGSDLVGNGTKWWTGPNPVGADGEPFSDFDTDAGGIQSTLGPFHPVNL